MRSRHTHAPDPTLAMDSPSKKQKAGSRPRSTSTVPIICAATVAITIFLSSSKILLKQSLFSSSSTNLRPTKPKMDYQINNKCTSLPTIKPAGTSFLNTPKFKRVLSPDAVSPSFYIGSVYGDRVRYHMSTDLVHFKLIKEHLMSWSKLRGSNNSPSSKTSESISGVAFDLGANQGFFTYYLAALGLDVHAFEINAENFQSLQHGQHYNGKSIAERVNLYPVGVDNKVHRFDMSGGSYAGYIKKKAESKTSDGDVDVGSDENAASILAVTFDCFAHHSRLDLSTIPFVKIDVEGFEIAALMGASNSLFSKKTKIGAMLMEVGPDRWNRASIDLETGIQEMAKVSTHFKQTYILLRKEEKGGTCPISIAEGVLADDKPEVIDDKVYKHKVAMNEWKGLLTKMNDNHWDCNFWYTN